MELILITDTECAGVCINYGEKRVKMKRPIFQPVSRSEYDW